MISRSKKLGLLGGIAVAVVFAVGGYLRYSPRGVPEGQPALVHLDAASMAALRDDFNAAGGGTRLLALLSPT